MTNKKFGLRLGGRNDKIQIPLTPFVKGGKRFSRDNVIFTPEIAFYSEEAIRRIMEVAADNINSLLPAS